MRRVYLDHNATSPLRPAASRVRDAEREVQLGNPSSAHAEGRAARAMLEHAREDLADLVGCHRDELVFTSGGTESNALALAAARAGPIAVAATEHPSVLAPARLRADTCVLPVNTNGRLCLPVPLVGRRLLSVALANHETGALADLGELAESCAEHAVLLHTDASQALGRIPLEFEQLGADLVTLSSHKLGGPVGIGALIVRSSVSLAPLFVGGPQEGGLRAGTEPALLAAMFAAAAREAVEALDESTVLWSELSAALRAGLTVAAPDVVVHSPPSGRLPNTLCFGLPGLSGAALVHRLDLEGIAVSHGSACTTGSLQPSRVLLAMGVDEALAASSIRVSMGPDNTLAEIEQLVASVRRARSAILEKAARKTSCDETTE